jgi:hypothetical protein
MPAGGHPLVFVCEKCICEKRIVAIQVLFRYHCKPVQKTAQNQFCGIFRRLLISRKLVLHY